MRCGTGSPLIGAISILLGVLFLATPVVADEAHGKAVFDKWCAGCHMDSPFAPGTILLRQTRGPENALIETRTDLPAAYIRHLVRKGNLGMPSFRRTEISNAELDAVVKYLADDNSDNNRDGK